MKYIITIVIILFLTACNPMQEQKFTNNPSKEEGRGVYVGAVDTEEFEAGMNSGSNIRLIDIRDQIELEMFGMLEGAEMMSYNSPDFIEKLDALPRDEKYYIYCNSGNRTGHTLKIMEQMGFQYVVHLDGGIQAWLRNNKTVLRCQEGRATC